MNILIFTGAGFTNPLGLPITSGFKKLINSIPTRLKSSLAEFLKSDVEDIEQQESCFNCDILNSLNYKDKEMLFDMYGFNRIELSNDEMVKKYGKNYKSDVLLVIKMLK